MLPFIAGLTVFLTVTPILLYWLRSRRARSHEVPDQPDDVPDTSGSGTPVG